MGLLNKAAGLLQASIALVDNPLVNGLVHIIAGMLKHRKQQ
ncbi:hypothetical protein IMSAG025_02479 [Muribaculaceae bacterium]|nr:hypothetical protein IMSAG025_02479 [Muribaculaceae bacterium]